MSVIYTGNVFLQTEMHTTKTTTTTTTTANNKRNKLRRLMNK